MQHSIVFAVAAVLLTVERLAYIWIYRQPRAFEEWAARTPLLENSGPIDAVSALFWIFKAIQGLVFAWWCWVHGNGAPISLAPHAGALVAGLACMAAGQYLNARVFTLLGRTGVFYGNRFGMSLPWRTEFPFSVLSHPQYVGTVLSIWGLFLVVRFPYPDWYALPLLETIYYLAGSQFEQ